ncbi:MAG: type II toxin-antitoxin system HicB family antitoxin [Ahrensia sp.]|nr:type II toxin-antitoxin system HicB family antitoxin [Ahrensia sp.]
MTKDMLDFGYHVQLEADPDGGFMVTCRDIPELITGGDSEADALWTARDGLFTALSTYLEQGKPLPAKTHSSGDLVYPMPSDSLKLAVMDALNKSGLTTAELAKRANLTKEDVELIVTWNEESDPAKAEQALAALGQRTHLLVEAA